MFIIGVIYEMNNQMCPIIVGSFQIMLRQEVANHLLTVARHNYYFPNACSQQSINRPLQ